MAEHGIGRLGKATKRIPNGKTPVGRSRRTRVDTVKMCRAGTIANDRKAREGVMVTAMGLNLSRQKREEPMGIAAAIFR